MSQLITAVVGAGLQGGRRAPAVVKSAKSKLKSIMDIRPERAVGLASSTGAKVIDSWREIAQDPEVKAVMVLTPPDSHFEIASEMLKAGKHVLCEKPMTRSSKQAQELVALAKKQNLTLKCGFNHRHHPAVLEAFKRFQAGVIGKSVFFRSRYGIGGREGIEKEWRSDPKVVSGGQLMEQGIHLVDLISWFAGGVSEVTAMVSTNRFPIAPLEDNGFVTLRTKSGAIGSIHSTLCQWINTFELEIYGELGSLTIEGLGASYGVEKLKTSINHASKPFEYETIEYRGGDVSWDKEWDEFVTAIEQKRQPIGSGEDGANAMRVIELAYQSNQDKRTLEL